jgi:hypothetical protein
MMAWEQDFTPSQGQSQTSQNWQADFTPANQNSQQQIQPQNDNFLNSIPAAPDWLTPSSDSTVGQAVSGIANNKFLAALGEDTANLGNGIINQVGGGIRNLMSEGQPQHTEDPNENQLNAQGLSLLLMANPAAGGGASLKSGEVPEPPSAVPSDLVVPKSSDVKLIKDKLEMAGITPQQYANALMNSSENDFAGELGGDPLRMQTQAQAKITGPAMQPAREAMRQRLETAPQRVQQIIEQTFYPSSAAEPTVGGDTGVMKGAAAPIEPIQQMQQNLVDIKSKLPDLYDAADQTTVAPRASLGVINTPAGQQAMKDTVTKLANQGISPTDAGIVIDQENGFHGLQPQVPVSTLHELSKSLGDQVVRNPKTGAIEDSQSGVIEGLRKHITSYLSENSPEFATANMNAAAQLQGQSAFEMGRNLAHSAAGEKADALMQRADQTFSPQELSYQKAGYAQGLADAIQGTPLGGGNPAARIAKGTIQNTSADILQSPTQAQQFADALMQEKNRIDLAQRGLGGSNTAETLSAGVPEIPTSPHGLLSTAAAKVMDFVNSGKNERLAQLLYATSPEQKAILARKIVQ